MIGHKAQQRVQQGGFATATGALEQDAFAGFDVQIQGLQAGGNAGVGNGQSLTADGDTHNRPFGQRRRETATFIRHRIVGPPLDDRVLCWRAVGVAQARYTPRAWLLGVSSTSSISIVFAYPGYELVLEPPSVLPLQ